MTLNGDGSALVEAAAHDIGNGTYTIMTQVAADALGLPPQPTRLPPLDDRHQMADRQCSQ